MLWPCAHRLRVRLLVVKSAGEEVNAVVEYPVDEAMLAGKTSRPGIRWQMLQRFRLADTCEWIAKYDVD